MKISLRQLKALIKEELERDERSEAAYREWRKRNPQPEPDLLDRIIRKISKLAGPELNTVDKLLRSLGL